jgi:hypothetical protein
LKQIGDYTIDEICAFYCEHTLELKVVLEGGSAVAIISGLAGFGGLKAALVIFAAGVGVSVSVALILLAFLIKAGILEKLCDCGKS